MVLVMLMFNIIATSHGIWQTRWARESCSSHVETWRETHAKNQPFRFRDLRHVASAKDLLLGAACASGWPSLNSYAGDSHSGHWAWNLEWAADLAFEAPAPKCTESCSLI